jgi:hypothetical protein
MAEKDIDALRTLMPELFEDRVVQAEFDGTLFVDIPSPDQPDKVDAESPSIAGDWIENRFTGLDDGFFDPELDVDLNIEATIQPLLGQFGGDFPGAPRFPGREPPSPHFSHTPGKAVSALRTIDRRTLLQRRGA